MIVFDNFPKFALYSEKLTTITSWRSLSIMDATQTWTHLYEQHKAMGTDGIELECPRITQLIESHDDRKQLEEEIKNLVAQWFWRGFSVAKAQKE